MNNGSALWARWQTLVRRHPRKTVLIDLAAGKTWSARTLDAWCRVDSLNMQGRDHTVALALPNGPAWVGHFLAAQRLGKTVVALDPHQPEEQRRELAERLGASCLYTEQGVVRWKPARRRYPGGTVFVKVTSGSTGTPQAWPCRAPHLLADGKNVCATMGIRASDKNLGLIPLGHSYGMGNLVMPLLLQGTAIAVAPAFVPGQIPEWIHQYRLTVFPTVPAVLRVLAHLPGRDLSPLRLAISAGAPLSPEIARAFQQAHGLVPKNFYGSSETGGIAYDPTGRGSLSGEHLGKPLQGVKIRIVRGQRIEVTSAAVLSADGRHILPDRGLLRPDGRLQLLGRDAAPANIGGRKVHPAEIQQLLHHLPQVREALVWVCQSKGRDVLAAAVETSLAEKDLQSLVGEKLSPWKMPKLWYVRTELPRTSRGKLDRAQIHASLQTNPRVS